MDFFALFNVISGVCSILGLVLTLVTLNKVNQIYKNIVVNIKQINKGTNNINYNRGEKNE